ncbi:hypothetical protein IIN94_004893 [Escherichia coli]|uniref:hypothetical protein n=1 Tax=Escherichia coli TaxID=562 RepID=UPI000A91AA87|nr:hypothetical protein [Escherichia coli]EEQ9688420.1 hypothetical protein [Escherichia coli]EEQ9775173.1 hypothetical protein [Escherichia coli]EES1815498.1 hypothetical protein [Escherichia coli]EFD0025874.1 hypothetical protein [Escherichia coli]EFF0518103.1 hypothetical protein [Escherichia coli]
MTADDRSIPESIHQSFSQLRDYLDAFSCLSDMIPLGEPDRFDFESLVYLLRMVSESLYVSLDVHYSTLLAEFVKR